MMTIFGMLAPEDVEAGFNLALDDDWFAVLLERDQVLAKFDPRDYTTAELHTEVEKLLRQRRSNPA